MSENNKIDETKINDENLFSGLFSVFFFLYFVLYLLIRIVFIDWIYGSFKGYKFIQSGKAGVLDIPQSDPVFYIYTILNYGFVILICLAFLIYLFQPFFKKR